MGRRAPRLLRRAALRHGERRQGLRGDGERQARAQRAKVMKFMDGFMISTGQPKKTFVSEASRNVMMRRGILGVKVKILMAHDPEGKMGPKTPMPDYVVIHEPEEDVV